LRSLGVSVTVSRGSIFRYIRPRQIASADGMAMESLDRHFAGTLARLPAGDHPTPIDRCSVAFSGGHSVSEGTKDSKHGRLAIELRWGRSAGLGGGMAGTTVAGRPVGELACNNVTATPAVRGPATARARRRRSRKMARFVVVLLQQLAAAGPRQLLRPSLAY
jgi:hypothetical protein